MNQVKNFAVVYAKKSIRKRKKNKLSNKLKLYKSYETVDLAANAILIDPFLEELRETHNIYIVEIVEE